MPTTLNTFIGLMGQFITTIGVGVTLWGIVQVGMSIQQHDASQRSQGIMTIAGGLLVAGAPAILAALGFAVGGTP